MFLSYRNWKLLKSIDETLVSKKVRQYYLTMNKRLPFFLYFLANENRQFEGVPDNKGSFFPFGKSFREGIVLL